MKHDYPVEQERMGKAVKNLQNEYASIRAGRANPAVLDRIEVDYYGTPTKINAMAAVSVAEARILVIAPWDASTIRDIEKAIQSSDIGINPQNDGKTIRLIFPPLTEERRKDITKQLKKLAEDAKVAVRNVRRDALDIYKTQKKNKEITEDDLKDAEKDLQKLVDNTVKEIDTIAAAKEKEIMEV